MFKKLLQFEFLYQRKQRSLIFLCIIFLAYGLLMGGMGQAPANIDFNAPYQLSYYTSLMTLGAIFITMFFAISAAVRDKEYDTESIVYSTFIKKHQYVFSRFIGAFLFGLIAFTPFFIGFALSVSFSGLDSERVADFNLLTYILPWVLFVIPNIFICAVVMFSISLLTKNNIATYVGGVGMYLLYMLASSALNSPLMASSTPPTPDGMFIAGLLDPFGIAAFFEQTQFWLPVQKNSEMVSISGLILWNRLLWIAMATVFLGLVYKIFSFRQLNQKVKKTVAEDISNQNTLIYSPIPVIINAASQRKAFIRLVKANLNGVFKSAAFIVIILMWVVLIGMDIYSRMFEGGLYNDSWYTSTNLLIGLISNQLPIFAIMLIVFFSGEITWRSRSNKFNEIIDATPTSNAAFFLSNFVSLLLLPVVLIASAVLIAIFFQVATGYTNFEFGLYVSLFYYESTMLIFYCILAIFIQSIIPNKYLGMGITVIAIFLFGTNSGIIGIEHPMLRIGIIPIPSYSNMNGFSVMTKAFTDFSFYWLSFGGVLAMLSFKLLQRGTIASWKVKFMQLGGNWGRQRAIGLAIMVLLLCTAATNIYYNTNIVNDYQSSATRLDAMEAYEKKYAAHKDLDRLFPVTINADVDLYPSTNTYAMKSVIQMKNKNSDPIAMVFINERAALSNIAFDHGKLVANDSVYGAYVFEFNPPIQPDETVQMTFNINRNVKGYANETAIVKNGTYITFRDYMPRMGYNSGMEIQNKQERKKRGLEALQEELITESHIENYSSILGKIHFEAVVSTAADQTAITTGSLIKTWKTDGRNYYHYKETEPILPTIAYFSAKYKTKVDTFNNIKIEQYYHPDHAYNIEKIAESTVETLDYCIENFGSYPFDYLRIAEIPSHWGFGGYAHPGVISMVEDRLYLIDISENPSFDLVAKRTIHEVAHQWWGGILTPKNVDGGALFVEGFAKYTEALLLEKMYGKGAIWQLSETANYQYFWGRTFTSIPEPPVYLEDGQNYIAYGKNLSVMLALKDVLGEAKLNSVLRTLIDRYRTNTEAQISTLDFLKELYIVAPEHRTLIDDWFKKVITYDLSITDKSYKKLDNNTYEISLKVKAKRFKTLDKGEVIPIDINEPILIGLFDKHPKAITKEDSIIYLKPHLINKEIMEFKIIVNELPKYISIDPYGTRSDENLVDNISRL